MILIDWLIDAPCSLSRSFAFYCEIVLQLLRLLHIALSESFAFSSETMPQPARLCIHWLQRRDNTVHGC